MKWTKLLTKYLAITITFLSFLISKTKQKDIYHSIDGSSWVASRYLNEAYFNKSKYYQSEQTNFQNLTFLSSNYTVPIESLPPYQYIFYKILEEDANGTLNYLTNLTINEYSAESNIFYDKKQTSYLSSSFSHLNYLGNKENFELNNKENNNRNVNDKYFLPDNINKNDNNKTIKSEPLALAISGNPPAKVECFVNYTGLSYEQVLDQKTSENSIYSNVVNFFSINFVTYKNNAGVFVEKYLNGKIANRTELSNFIINKNSFADFSKVKFAKILPSFLYQKHYLFILDEQNLNIYLLRIKSNEQQLKEFNPQINSLVIETLFAFENKQIEKFDFKNLLAASLIQEQTSVYLVTQSALFVVYYTNKVTNIVSVDSFEDLETAQAVKFQIINAVFDKDGCYIALMNYGLLAFNTKEAKLSLVFRHPKIQRIDSFFFEDKNIGVFLNNNNTGEGAEFLIELNKPNYIFKGNYTVNKIFFSSAETSSKADYYSKGILDTSSSRSFIIEKNSNKVYLIARNLPYQINNIDTIFSLPEELRNKAFNYFNLVSVFEDKSKAGRTFPQGILLLQTEDHFQYRFFRFEFNVNGKFSCEIKQAGTYWFKHQFYSFDDKQLVFYALDKKIKLYKSVEYEDQDYTFLVILVIILAAAAIFGVYFCLKKWRESRIMDNYTNIIG